ncbi:MAG: hypothetical protein ABIR81_02920 [Ginsengibacter sp.]
MNQSTSISTFFHNLKRTFYAIQVVCLTLALPTLAAIGINHHHEKTETKVETSVRNSGSDKDISFNFDLPTATFRSK